MILPLFLFVLISFGNCSYPARDIKCLVCKRVVQELEKEISQVNPNKKINLGHRINSKGEVIQKTYIMQTVFKSQVFIRDNKYKGPKISFKIIVSPPHPSFKMSIALRNKPCVAKKFARSEIHLSELMDTICEKMDNYVRAKKKDTGKLDVIPLISDSGLMNPNFGEYEIIQDSDLNKSLKFYCESIIEEFDSEIYDNLSKEIKDSEGVICIETTKLCDSLNNAKNEL